MWIGVWLIGIDLIVRSVVDLLSSIGKPEYYLRGALFVAGVIEIDGKPKNKVVDFAEELDEMATTNDNTYNETAIRLFQYFSISLAAYIIFLWSDEVHFNCFTNWIIIGVLALMLIALVAIGSVANYFDTSLLKLRKDFRAQAYFQMVKNALNTNTNRDYKIDARIRRIFLEKKERFPYPPIKLTPLYVWNYNLGEKKMVDDLKGALKSLSDEDIQKKIQDYPIYNVIVTNIKPEAIREFISKLDMGIYIYAETREDIDNGIEEMFYKINNENFMRLTKKIEIQKDIS